MHKHVLGFSAAALVLAACATSAPIAQSSASLANTGWQLVQFKSSGEADKVIRPGDPSKYQLMLLGGGQLAMKLDCSSGTGKWSLVQSGINRGNLNLSPAEPLRAACAAGSLDAQIARDIPHVRNYALNGGRLDLSLDSGATYSWQRIDEY